jgi:hypothetical protein
MPKQMRPTFALSVEVGELGINAGLQVRCTRSHPPAILFFRPNNNSKVGSRHTHLLLLNYFLSPQQQQQ